MQQLIEKAAVLIEALPYIQTFRNEIVVVKFGGSAMEDPAQVARVLADITFMECIGMRPVVVHGGGKAISRGMTAHGIEPNFVHGLRVTCEETIKVVEQVINEEVNPRVVAGLRDHGARAHGLKGSDVFSVSRMTGEDPQTGAALDWGFVGEPDEVDVTEIRCLIEQDTIPVITPLGMGRDGNVHNVNADVAAAAVAKALQARKLVFLSDVPGLMRDPSDESSVIGSLTATAVEELIADGTIAGGMLPKVRSCMESLHAGVRKVHMIDGRSQHSLLLEIFTDEGVGTEIVND